jgi:hypothetical protein
VGSSLPLADAGLASAGHAVRAASARAVHAALRAAAAAGEAAAARSPDGVEELLNQTVDDAKIVASALTAALKSATAGSLLEPGPIGSDGLVEPSLGAVDPRAFAELSLLVFSAMPIAGVALSTATRAVMLIERGKGEKSSAAAALSSAAKKALTAIGVASGALARELDDVAALIGKLYASLDAEVVKAMHLVVGGWDAATQAWAPTVQAAAASTDWSHDHIDDVTDAALNIKSPSVLALRVSGDASPSSAEGLKMPTAELSAAIPPGPGRAWLARVEDAQTASFKRGYRDPMRLVGAGYTEFCGRLKTVSASLFSNDWKPSSHLPLPPIPPYHNLNTEFDQETEDRATLFRLLTRR